MPDPAVAALLTTVATELEGLEQAGAAGTRTWSVGGTVFARETPVGVELRLDPAVAAAALRTADTHRSDDGPDRIVFRPGVVDRFAEDRLRAWFTHAHRLAREGPTGRASEDTARRTR
jgi:hypothetical protein